REPARQGEAQTGALLAPPWPGVELLELAEDPRLVLFRDADPGVGDRDVDRVRAARGFDGHGAAVSRELDGVGQQVEQHLLELAAVDGDLPGARGVRDDG